MAVWGVPIKSMCQHIRDPNSGEPLSPRTLGETFQKELAAGTAIGDVTLTRNIWGQANGRPAEYGEVNGKVVKLRDELKPQPGPAIYLTKVRLGWRETSVVEHHNFNTAVFNDMKEQLGKLSRDDLIEIGNRWKSKLGRKTEARQAVRALPERDREGS